LGAAEGKFAMATFKNPSNALKNALSREIANFSLGECGTDVMLLDSSVFEDVPFTKCHRLVALCAQVHWKRQSLALLIFLWKRREIAYGKNGFRGAIVQ
jgi:hypothetical protein